MARAAGAEGDAGAADLAAELEAERAFSAQLAQRVKAQAAQLEERTQLLDEAAAAAEAAEAALAAHTTQAARGGGGGAGDAGGGGGGPASAASALAHRRLDMRGVPSHVISVIAGHKQATLEAEGSLRKATRRLAEAERRESHCRQEKLEAQRASERRHREASAMRAQMEHLQGAHTRGEGARACGRAAPAHDARRMRACERMPYDDHTHTGVLRRPDKPPMRRRAAQQS